MASCHQALLIKWRYLNMLEYTKAPFSSKTMISLWLFITIYWILWVLNSQRLYTQEGWVCFLVRALSDRFSLWGFFYPHPLSKEAYPCIYPLCFIPWGMGGKVCSGQGIYFAFKMFIISPTLVRRPGAKQFGLCRHFCWAHKCRWSGLGIKGELPWESPSPVLPTRLSSQKSEHSLHFHCK